MAISNEHFNTIVYLSDINTQCLLFKRSYEQLKIAAAHWINICNGIDGGTKFSPLNIIAECTVCLSAMSAIKRVLNSDRPASAKKRSDELLELLGNPSLDHTFTKKVRNSWEHHDERLDKILNTNSECKRLCEIHVAVNPPKEGTLTLKRFDPTKMTIHFLNDVIELTPCLYEMLQLTESINQAIQKLHR